MTGAATASRLRHLDNFVVSCGPVSGDGGLRRLDVLLVERGLAPSRERAQALVAAGLVIVDGVRARSVAQRVGAEGTVSVTTL